MKLTSSATPNTMQLSSGTDLAGEGSLYIGIILAAILYGIYDLIFFLSVHYLPRNADLPRREEKFFMIFSFVLMLLNTLAFASTPLMGQMMWIVHRDEAGGPPEYYNNNVHSAWYMILGSVSQTFTNFFTSALLTYRCYVIVGRRSAIMPALFSTAFLVVSIVNDVPSMYSDKLNFACVLILTVSNVFVTGAISSHLVSTRRIVVPTVPAQRVSRYLGFVAFIIEASPLWTILSIFISSTCLLKHSWPIGAKQIWDICGAIAAQLIIYHIAVGQAWTDKVEPEMRGVIPSPAEESEGKEKPTGAARPARGGPGASLVVSDWHAATRATFSFADFPTNHEVSHTSDVEGGSTASREVFATDIRDTTKEVIIQS